ncbi:MAG: LamG domain-containing protein [Clostridia bacterium]|nr:LamG domain-containing protein [Clostridia bacterium]MDD4048656.1 LamG domain-containing protein [Clostridia bacterium]
MDSRKTWQIFFILGLCLCLNLLFPGFAQATDENEGMIGGGDYNGVIDEVTIHDDTSVSPEEILANYINGIDGTTVAKWQFDEGKGLTASDSIRSNDGTLNGGVTWVNGIKGKAVSFDGGTGSIEVPLSPELTMTTNSFTMEAWIKFSDIPAIAIPIVSNIDGSSSQTRFWALGILNDGKLFIGFNGDDSYPHIVTDSPIDVGSWHYLVAVRDASVDSLSFYMDGMNVGTVSDTSGNLSSNTNIFIGNEKFKGCIDEVTISRLVLGEADIQERYQNAPSFVDLKVKDTFGKSSIKSVYDATIPCKLGFNLIKGVSSMEIDVNIPDMLRISDVGAVFKNGVEQCAVTYEGNKFYISDYLGPGSYEITYDVKYNTIYSIASAVVNGIEVEMEPFTVEFVEYPSLL